MDCKCHELWKRRTSRKQIINLLIYSQTKNVKVQDVSKDLLPCQTKSDYLTAAWLWMKDVCHTVVEICAESPGICGVANSLMANVDLVCTCLMWPWSLVCLYLFPSFPPKKIIQDSMYSKKWLFKTMKPSHRSKTV